MTSDNYKYTIDKLFDFLRFAWKHRNGNKYIKAFRIYKGLVGICLVGAAFSFYANSEGIWGINVSYGEIGLIDLCIFLVISFVFIIVLHKIGLPEYNENQIRLLKSIERKQFLLSLNPIKSFADFSRFYNTHSVVEYVDTKKLSELRSIIVEKENKHVRLLSLSGTGKTFLVYRAFTEMGDTENVFYCDNVKHANVLSAMESLCSYTEDATVILDNCPDVVFNQMISNFGQKLRIISLYYDPNDYSNIGYKLLNMDEVEIRSIIDDIIEQNKTVELTGQQKEFIIHHSGDIPMMALLLVQAYNSGANFSNVQDANLLNHLLGYEGNDLDLKRIATRTLSLCQPLDYNDGNSAVANYLITSDCFTPMAQTVKKDVIFKDVVGTLLDRGLLEQESVFINMRPQPLAIWVVGEWLRQQGRMIKDTIAELSSQPPQIRDGILEPWAKRLEFMQGNKDAENLYSELVKLNGGPFANEDVVCSDFGSRLILAMATVNPVAVSECLYAILYKKPIEWLKDNLVGDARRNIVRTLEKLCFCAKTFQQSAHTLARLAISENEKWANNSEGQFKQLFHIALAGTECNLNCRYEVLKSLYRSGIEYHDLLLSAICGAYAHQNLHRMGGPEKFGFIELEDYTPTWLEIDEYWSNIWSLLVEWMDVYPKNIDTISGIVVRNSRMLVRADHASTLFEYIAYIAQKLNNRWDAMHKALVEVKNYDVMSPKDGEVLLHWIEELTPKDIVSRMRDAVHDLYSKVHKGSDALDREEDVVLPFVVEFVSTKGYLTEEIHDVISNNKDYLSWAFTKNLALQIPIEDLPEFWKYVITYIRLQDKNFYSQFLLRFISELPDFKQAYTFIQSLFRDGYLRMSISLMGVSDNKEYDWLGFCLDETHANKLDISFIRYYINVLRLRETEHILSMGKFMKDRGADNCLLFDHYATYWYLDELYKDANCLIEYKSAILNYPLDATELYNHEFNLAVRTLLEKHHDNEFAKVLNHKLREYLSNNQSRYHVEDLYKVLLVNYYDVIWLDFAKALTDIDNHSAFFFNVYYTVKAGVNFEEKCLYDGHYDEMKQLCYDYDYGAWVCAGTCPVFADSENGIVSTFHPFAIWLIENYGGKEHVIEEFSANMGTFHWTGSAIPLYEDQKRCLDDLLQNHKINPKVKDWAEKRLKVVNSDTERERQNDAYMRMTYGK